LQDEFPDGFIERRIVVNHFHETGNGKLAAPACSRIMPITAWSDADPISRWWQILAADSVDLPTCDLNFDGNLV
jgi:hypothetical protein